MQISVAEAINLKSLLTKKHDELLCEQRNIESYYTETEDKPEENPLKMESIIDELENEMITLDQILAASNVVTIVTSSEALTVQSAIQTARLQRARLERLKRYASQRKKVQRSQYDMSMGRSIQVNQVLVYDPEELKPVVQALERFVTRLSLAIDACNVNTIVEVSFADKYL